MEAVCVADLLNEPVVWIIAIKICRYLTNENETPRLYSDMGLSRSFIIICLVDHRFWGGVRNVGHAFRWALLLVLPQPWASSAWLCCPGQLHSRVGMASGGKAHGMVHLFRLCVFTQECTRAPELLSGKSLQSATSSVSRCRLREWGELGLSTSHSHWVTLWCLSPLFLFFCASSCI